MDVITYAMVWSTNCTADAFTLLGILALISDQCIQYMTIIKKKQQKNNTIHLKLHDIEGDLVNCFL